MIIPKFTATEAPSLPCELFAIDSTFLALKLNLDVRRQTSGQLPSLNAVPKSGIVFYERHRLVTSPSDFSGLYQVKSHAEPATAVPKNSPVELVF